MCMLSLAHPPVFNLSTDPHILPKLQVDKGAVKFVLSGANIMCPGLTSPGAKMEQSVPEKSVVVSSDNSCPLVKGREGVEQHFS